MIKSFTCLLYELLLGLYLNDAALCGDMKVLKEADPSKFGARRPKLFQSAAAQWR